MPLCGLATPNDDILIVAKVFTERVVFRSGFRPRFSITPPREHLVESHVTQLPSKSASSSTSHMITENKVRHQWLVERRKQSSNFPPPRLPSRTRPPPSRQSPLSHSRPAFSSSYLPGVSTKVRHHDQPTDHNLPIPDRDQDYLST